MTTTKNTNYLNVAATMFNSFPQQINSECIHVFVVVAATQTIFTVATVALTKFFSSHTQFFCSFC